MPVDGLEHPVRRCDPCSMVCPASVPAVLVSVAARLLRDGSSWAIPTARSAWIAAIAWSHGDPKKALLPLRRRVNFAASVWSG